MVLLVERHCETHAGTRRHRRQDVGAARRDQRDPAGRRVHDRRPLGRRRAAPRGGRGDPRRVRGDRRAPQRRRSTLAEFFAANAAPCDPALQEAFARGDCRARHPGAPSAERRRSRRDGVSGRGADGDAVRALRQQRHQPSPRRNDDRRGCRHRDLGAAAFFRELSATRMDSIDELGTLDRRPSRRADRIPARDRPRAVRHAARRQRAGGGKSGGAPRRAGLRRRAPSGAGRVPARVRDEERHQPDRAPALRQRRSRRSRSTRTATSCRPAKAGRSRRTKA